MVPVLLLEEKAVHGPGLTADHARRGEAAPLAEQEGVSRSLQDLDLIDSPEVAPMPPWPAAIRLARPLAEHDG